MAKKRKGTVKPSAELDQTVSPPREEVHYGTPHTTHEEREETTTTTTTTRAILNVGRVVVVVSSRSSCVVCGVP